MSTETTESHIINSAWDFGRIIHGEQMASRYAGQLRIYWINSNRQLTKDGPPALELGKRQSNPTLQKESSML
jgi:hypothetical protein